MGLAYTLTAKYDTKLIDSGVPVFYNSLYSDLKDGIVSDSKMLSELYGKIGNSAIKSHKIHGLLGTQRNSIRKRCNGVCELFIGGIEFTCGKRSGSRLPHLGGKGMKKKKYRGIEQLKSRYGWLFISTWLVGVIAFLRNTGNTVRNLFLFTNDGKRGAALRPCLSE